MSLLGLHALPQVPQWLKSLDTSMQPVVPQ